MCAANEFRRAVERRLRSEIAAPREGDVRRSRETRQRASSADSPRRDDDVTGSDR